MAPSSTSSSSSSTTGSESVVVRGSKGRHSAFEFYPFAWSSSAYHRTGSVDLHSRVATPEEGESVHIGTKCLPRLTQFTNYGTSGQVPSPATKSSATFHLKVKQYALHKQRETNGGRTAPQQQKQKRSHYQRWNRRELLDGGLSKKPQSVRVLGWMASSTEAS